MPGLVTYGSRLIAPPGSNILLGMPSRKPTFLAASKAVFDAMTPAPTLARQMDVDRFIRALQAPGVDIWSVIDGFWWNAAHSASASLINIRNPGTYNMTAEGSPAPVHIIDRGHSTNGSSAYLDTHFDPSTAVGAHYTRDSAMFGFYCLTYILVAGTAAGWFDGTDGFTIAPRTTDDTLNFRENQTPISVETAGVATSGEGLFAANRSGSALLQFYRNGAAITIATEPTRASVALNAGTFKLGRFATASYNAREFACAFIGGSLTAAQHLAFSKAILVYLQSVLIRPRW